MNCTLWICVEIHQPPAVRIFGRGRERQPCRDPRRLQAESLGGAPWRPDVLGWVADVFFLDALPTIDDNRWLMMLIDWLIYVNTCWYMLIQYTSVHPYCWGSALFFFFLNVCFRIDERTMPLSFDMFRISHGDTAWFSHWWMMSCEPIYEIYWGMWSVLVSKNWSWGSSNLDWRSQQTKATTSIWVWSKIN